jgi:hypothetical protein
MVNAFTMPDPRENFRFFSDPFRWKKHEHGFADAFLRRITKKFFRTAIPTGDDAVQGFTDDCIVGRFDNRRQPERSHFRQFAFSDVSTDGNILTRFAVLVEEWNNGCVHPIK